MKKVLGEGGIQKLGIQGMKERAESLGGEFIIKSSPGKGTEIYINLPTEGSQEERAQK